MPIPALAVAGGSALASLLGGWFSGKSKAKNEKARSKESDAAQRRAWDQKEKQRVARLKSILSAAQSKGIDIGQMDPGLLMVRPWPGPDSTVGMSNGPGWSDALQGIGQLGMNYAAGMGAGGPAAEAAARGPIQGIEDGILTGGPARQVAPIGGSAMGGTQATRATGTYLPTQDYVDF